MPPPLDIDWTATAMGMFTLARVVVEMMETQEKIRPRRRGEAKKKAILDEITSHEDSARAIQFASFLIDLLADRDLTKELARLKLACCWGL